VILKLDIDIDFEMRQSFLIFTIDFEIRPKHLFLKDVGIFLILNLDVVMKKGQF